MHPEMIMLEVADRMVSLDAGDAASFAGDIPHAHANGGTQPASFSLAVFEPGGGPGCRPEVCNA